MIIRYHALDNINIHWYNISLKLHKTSESYYKYMTLTVTQWKSKIVNFSWGENTKRIESTCFQSYTFSRPTKVICYILISCKTWTNYLWNCTFNLSPQFYIIAIFLEFWHEMSSSSVLLRKNVSEFLFKIKPLSIACHSRFEKN